MIAMWNEEKERGLTEFSKRSDKEYALYFVGRRDVISGIEDTVDQMRRLMAGRAASNLVGCGLNLSDQRTWLVQGAPGAGKTALLSHLRQIWERRKDGPVSVSLDPLDLEDESELTHVIANRIRSDGGEILKRVRTRELAGGLNFWGGGFDFRTAETERQGALTLRDLWRLYDRRLSDVIRDHLPKKIRSGVSALRPVVLMVDEVQKLGPEGEKLLLRIHLGRHGLPIVAVLAGLAWSQTRLAEAGISRLSQGHVRTLRTLAGAEAAEAVRLLLEKYEIEGSGDAAIAGKIAAWSNGWPQHLHNYMRVLATELRDGKGDLAAVDENRLRAEGNRMRKDYYARRLISSSITACVNLLADVAEMIGEGGCSEPELLDLLGERVWKEKQKSADCMPRSMEPQEFVGEMIRAGIIHKEKRRIIIPIPSFRQHLIESRLND